MNPDLALAALHRLGRPSTAADIFDCALGLGRSAGWPREHLGGSVQKFAKLLERMNREDNSVFVVDRVLENGNSRNLWAPTGDFTSGYPIPPPPSEKGSHPLDDMNREQTLAVFDVADATLFELRRQRRELRAVMDRHEDELERLMNRARQRLATVGLT
jgi:hypothetical protein